MLLCDTPRHLSSTLSQMFCETEGWHERISEQQDMISWNIIISKSQYSFFLIFELFSIKYKDTVSLATLELNNFLNLLLLLELFYCIYKVKLFKGAWDSPNVEEMVSMWGHDCAIYYFQRLLMMCLFVCFAFFSCLDNGTVPKNTLFQHFFKFSAEFCFFLLQVQSTWEGYVGSLETDVQKLELLLQDHMSR